MSSRGGKEPPLTGTTRLAFMGVMLALSAALSFGEAGIAALMMLPPGIKPGLSNIVTMYCLFLLGGKNAVTLVVLKAVFVLLTRSPSAGLLSLCGGMVSIIVMVVLRKLLPTLNESYLSVAGALCHNLGQLGGAALLLNSAYTFYYLPVLIISGVVMGMVTGTLLKLVLPHLKGLSGLILSPPQNKS